MEIQPEINKKNNNEIIKKNGPRWINKRSDEQQLYIPKICNERKKKKRTRTKKGGKRRENYLEKKQKDYKNKR